MKCEYVYDVVKCLTAENLATIVTIVALFVALIIASVTFLQSKRELRRKNNLEFLGARKDLRDRLIELMVFPKNYDQYYKLRRIYKQSIIFDEYQPLLPPKTSVPNDGFYHTILDDLHDLSSEVKIWFPELNKQYVVFLNMARESVRSVVSAKQTELAEASFAKFDAIVEEMNVTMSKGIR